MCLSRGKMARWAVRIRPGSFAMAHGVRILRGARLPSDLVGEPLGLLGRDARLLGELLELQRGLLGLASHLLGLLLLLPEVLQDAAPHVVQLLVLRLADLLLLLLLLEELPEEHLRLRLAATSRLLRRLRRSLLLHVLEHLLAHLAVLLRRGLLLRLDGLLGLLQVLEGVHGGLLVLGVPRQVRGPLLRTLRGVLQDLGPRLRVLARLGAVRRRRRRRCQRGGVSLVVGQGRLGREGEDEGGRHGERARHSDHLPQRRGLLLLAANGVGPAAAGTERGGAGGPRLRARGQQEAAATAHNESRRTRGQSSTPPGAAGGLETGHGFERGYKNTE
mmetsp:Transcript_60586/g.131310  ORF Transcript_60586/g.131310 Transcript_60586/m.131310 type:complete len:332 (+) Transcript_60586:10-1005(+)